MAIGREGRRQSFNSLDGVPFSEGFDALAFGGTGFFGFRISLLLLRWPLAMLFPFGFLDSQALLPVGELYVHGRQDSYPMRVISLCVRR